MQSQILPPISCDAGPFPAAPCFTRAFELLMGLLRLSLFRDYCSDAGPPFVDLVVGHLVVVSMNSGIETAKFLSWPIQETVRNGVLEQIATCNCLVEAFRFGQVVDHHVCANVIQLGVCSEARNGRCLPIIGVGPIRREFIGFAYHYITRAVVWGMVVKARKEVHCRLNEHWR